MGYYWWQMDLKRCIRCLYPETKPGIWFNDDGLCAACIAFDDRALIDWEARRKEFREFSGERCIVPVSGGKDSTFQIVKALEYGLRPLAITAMTDSLTPLGRLNLDNIAKLGVDHIEVKTNPIVRRKINKFTLTEIGDISWAEHVTIFSIPVRMSLLFKIPLILWGENPQNEYGGPSSSQTMQRLNSSWLQEFGGLNGLRVADVQDLLDLSDHDMAFYRYPSDRELTKHGNPTGLFLGYFFPWDGYANAHIARDHGFKWSDRFVEGSICSWENLDNFQTGIHDYFKYLKFGFGRATDIASNMIRRKIIGREEAIGMIKDRDGMFPQTYMMADLSFILGEIGMSYTEFGDVVRRFVNKSLFDIDPLNFFLIHPKFEVK
jgi:N-acetyl sugar amidotransferase